VSSTAPNVGIAPAVAPSQRPQTLPALQDNGTTNDTSPFALLLDAAATTPSTANPPQPAGPVMILQRAPAAGDQGGTKHTFAGRNDAGAAPSPSSGPAATAPADPAATAAAGAGANPSPAQNPPAGQAGATSPADLTSLDPQLAALPGALTAPISNDASADSAAPASTAKTRSDSGDSQDDSATDVGAAAATAGQPQPLAAVFVANAVIATPPAAADATGSDATIGGSGGAKPLSPYIGSADLATSQGSQVVSASTGDSAAGGDIQAAANGNAAAAQAGNGASIAQNAGNGSLAQGVKAAALGQDASVAPPISPDGKIAAPATPNTKPTAPGQSAKPNAPQPSAAPNGGDTVSTGSPVDPTNGQAWNASAAPQPQARADGDDGAPAQSGGGATTHVDALAPSDAGGSANTQAAKATDGMPNFGFAAIAPPATAATTATPAAAATANAAVPIAGLPVAIAARALDGSTQFDIRLDPPELGRIAVRLDVDRDGQVTSHVTVDRADTLQLLQSQQPLLERALEQAGLKTADNGLQFTLRDQSFTGQNGQSGGSGGQANPATIVIPDADQPAIPTTQVYSRLARVSGIDIRV